MRPNQIKSRRNLGRFTPATDLEDARFASEITPQDIELMREQWQKYASPAFDDLIDAGSEGGPAESATDLVDVTAPDIVKREGGRKPPERRVIGLPEGE